MANVTKQMSIKEVLKLDPGTAEVFLSFGMACLSCPYATAESLAEASAAHGVSADALVEKLNARLAQKG
jgi:hybrid cluster-associated redox disulfide protein